MSIGSRKIHQFVKISLFYPIQFEHNGLHKLTTVKETMRLAA